MPRLWEMKMSSRFPEIGKCALPACSEGRALSGARLLQAEGLESPRGLFEWEEGTPDPGTRRRKTLGTEPNFKSQGKGLCAAPRSSGQGGSGSPRQLLGLEG